MKKHSERFTNAVIKLYNAFHENRLNANDCSACAVGNICDGNANWTYLLKDYHGTGILTSEKDKLGLGTFHTKNTGYSPLEILTIEKLFMRGCEWDSYTNINPDKEQQFNGLYAVVKYLCELEGIPNIMDYTKLFEIENDKPKHQLIEVL